MTTNILLFPILGSVQTVIIPIMGQIIMSMLIDHFGLFGSTKVPLTFISLCGMFLLVIGVVIVIVLPNYLKKNLQQDVSEQIPQKWLWQLLGLLAGCAIAIQVAINGQLGVQLHSSIHAALISFTVGTILLCFIMIIQKSFKNVMLLKEEKTHWYIYIGGVLGALYVFINASLVPIIGAGTVVVLVILGQIISSLCIEHIGFLGAPIKRITNLKILGVIFMIIGIYFIKL